MAETRMVDGIQLGPNSPQVGEDGTVTAPVEQKPAGDRPAWLPQNFDKPEAMVESYKSLQAELTKLKQGTNTEADPAETPEAKAAREAEEAAKAAAEGEKPATENKIGRAHV